MGVGSIPQLIIGGEVSLVKINGYPYVPTMRNDLWHFMHSTNHNPIRLMLELIYTKLDLFFGTNLTEDYSTDLEPMSVCLSTKASIRQGQPGWEYYYTDLSEQILQERSTISKWSPTELTDVQMEIISLLCQGTKVYFNDGKIIRLIRRETSDISNFVNTMLSTQLIARKGYELRLTTIQCQTVFTPDGKCWAGENNANQLMNWLLENYSGKPIVNLI